MAGVRAPTMEALTTLAGDCLDIDYHRDGFTLDRMGVTGIEPAGHLPVHPEWPATPGLGPWTRAIADQLLPQHATEYGTGNGTSSALGIDRGS